MSLFSAPMPMSYTTRQTCTHTDIDKTQNKNKAHLFVSKKTLWWLLATVGWLRSVPRHRVRVRAFADRCHCSRWSRRDATLSPASVVSAGQRHVVQRWRPAAVVGDDSLISGGSDVIRWPAFYQRSAGRRWDIRVCSDQRPGQSGTTIFITSCAHCTRFDHQSPFYIRPLVIVWNYFICLDVFVIRVQDSRSLSSVLILLLLFFYCIFFTVLSAAVNILYGAL